MVTPTKSEIDKRNKKLESWLKSLNPDGSMSEKKLCTLIRSSVRKVWFSHPVKLSYLYKKSYPDMNPKTRTKWLIDCEMCGNTFKLTDVQVDHKKGEHSLLCFDDIVPFAQSILGVTHDDLQILCIPCHETRTYSERYGVTIEEAARQKIIIAKLKQPVTKQKLELKKFGYTPKQISNEALRRSCYSELLDKGEIK